MVLIDSTAPLYATSSSDHSSHYWLPQINGLFCVSGENMMWRARLYHNDALFKQAKDLRSPSCEALQDLRVLATGGDTLVH
jgi:hypothetical protein